MRKVVYHCQMNMVGTDSWVFCEVSDEMSDKELEELGQELANDNAEMYGYSSYPNEDLEYDEDDEFYDDTIGACMHEYVAELHDMCTTTGVPDWKQY